METVGLNRLHLSFASARMQDPSSLAGSAFPLLLRGYSEYLHYWAAR